MDLSEIAKKLGLSESKDIVRKGAELRRLCDVQFDSSVIGVGEVCKAIICLEIAATRFQVIFDRQAAIRLSGMSEKAYNRSFNSLQNSLGVKTKLDIRELGIQFGCVRLIPFVKNGLSMYKQRFLAALPASRQATADFTRPVFTAVAFYLCAKKHKLKIDKLKLIEVCGTSESEFTSVSTSMKDLCHDLLGILKEKDAKEIKCNRELLDVLPEKRKYEDGGYLSEDGEGLSSYKKRKRAEKAAYEDWKSSVMSSNKKNKAEGSLKRTRQTRLDFLKEAPAITDLGTFSWTVIEAAVAMASSNSSVFKLSVMNLWREPLESMQVLALWLWLERMGYRNFIKKILSLPSFMINDLADETITCLNCITNDRFTCENIAIPLLQSLTGKEVSLKHLYNNRLDAVQGVAKAINEICIRAVQDIMREAIERNTTKISLVSQASTSPCSSSSLQVSSTIPPKLDKTELNPQAHVILRYTQKTIGIPPEDRTMFVTCFDPFCKIEISLKSRIFL